MAQIRLAFGVLALVAACDASTPAPWTVPYGDEFWRARAAAGQVNVGEVVDRVSHAIGRQDGALPRAADRSYSATFDGRGVRFAPDGAGELRIQTARVAIGEHVVYRGDGGPAAWSVVGNTAQARLSNAVVEHYETRSEGVELSWVLRDRPAAGADMVVEVALAGMPYAATSATGLHYADATGTPRVRLGAAELVDARGRRWPVPAERVAGGVRWRVDPWALAEAEFPVALDPMVGAEFGMDNPVSVGASDDQYDASIASNGSMYLVVWQEFRADLAYSDVYGCRVSPAGVVLDPSGIIISAAINAQSNPGVASNGTNFLVAWSDTRSDATGLSTDVYAARVTAATGVVLDPGGLVISTAPGQQGSAVVASAGADYLVAWQDSNTGLGENMYATRVTAAGAVLDSSGIVLETASGLQHNPAIASNGSDYLVAWEDTRNSSDVDVYGTRVSSAGVVLNPNGIAISTASLYQYTPTVASNGTDYLVAWLDTRSPISEQEVYGTRVSAAGTVLNPTGIQISNSVSQTPDSKPAAGSNGTDYFVVWSEYQSPMGALYNIYGSRVTAAGTVLDSPPVTLSTGASFEQTPCIASVGGDYLVAWDDQRSNTGKDIHGRRVSSVGTLLDASHLILSTEPNQQFAPSVASNGNGYLIAWEDNRGGTGTDIYASRVDSAGAILDTSGLAVSTAANDQAEPSVGSNGSDYFVAWRDARSGAATDIYGTPVTAAGLVQNPSGIAVATAANIQQHPSLAGNDTDYFVAWQDRRGGGSEDVYGTRLSAAGVVQTPGGLVLSAASNDQRGPSVASNGTDYLVVWQDDRSITTDIYGGRVSSIGTLLDASGIALAVAVGQQVSPAVGSNGVDYFVAWQDARSGTSDDVYGTRVSAAGAVLDPAGLAISAASVSQQLPAVASNGTEYVVAWQDTRSGTDQDVYACRVTLGGAVVDGAGLAVSTTANAETNPRLAYNAANSDILVAYNSAGRVRARLISPVCGDGALDGRPCDDGDMQSGDGCSSSCDIEPGYVCNGAPSVCVDIDECSIGTDDCTTNAACTNLPGSFSCTCDVGYHGDGVTGCVTECGDGIAAGDEACDDGDDTLVCDADCTAVMCGDDYVNSVTEDCDDGNQTDGDGCDSNCTDTACGNNIITAGETCDDGNTAGGDGCSASCLVEPPAVCGNGVVENGEECEDLNGVDGDGCSATCQLEPPGDGGGSGDCGCVVAPRRRSVPVWPALLGALAVLVVRRRRR